MHGLAEPKSVRHQKTAEPKSVRHQKTGTKKPGTKKPAPKNPKIYDPSYGGAVPYSSENDHENAAIDGIKAEIGGEDRAKKNDTGTQELYYTRSSVLE